MFFKEMVPIQVKKLHKKIFVPEIPWDIVAKKYILNVWYIFRGWGKTGCKCHKMGSFFVKKLRAK